MQEASIEEQVESIEDPIEVSEEELLRKLGLWKEAEADRAKAAGETRQEIGEFVDRTNLAKKALAHWRQIFKMPPDKQADYLRSWDVLAGILREKLASSAQGDLLDGGEKAAHLQSVG